MTKQKLKELFTLFLYTSLKQEKEYQARLFIASYLEEFTEMNKSGYEEVVNGYLDPVDYVNRTLDSKLN